MALKMICSHWLVCGWIMSLLVGTGVAIFQRYADPSRFTSLRLSLPTFPAMKWDAGWTCYAEIRGRLDEERMQIGRSDHPGVAGPWRAEDGSGCSYA